MLLLVLPSSPTTAPWRTHPWCWVKDPAQLCKLGGSGPWRSGPNPTASVAAWDSQTAGSAGKAWAPALGGTGRTKREPQCGNYSGVFLLGREEPHCSLAAQRWRLTWVAEPNAWPKSIPIMPPVSMLSMKLERWRSPIPRTQWLTHSNAWELMKWERRDRKASGLLHIFRKALLQQENRKWNNFIKALGRGSSYR